MNTFFNILTKIAAALLIAAIVAAITNFTLFLLPNSLTCENGKRKEWVNKIESFTMAVGTTVAFLFMVLCLVFAVALLFI